MAIATINPATGETVKTFTPHTDAEVDERLGARGRRLPGLPAHDLRRAGAPGCVPRREILDAERDEIARMMTDRDGQDARRRPGPRCRSARGPAGIFAEHAERLLADEPADAASVGASRAYARYQPLGPVLAVMPWNFPLWQVIRFAAPALMAGNVGLLKHASNVPQTALFLEDVFRRAGFPDGAFQTLLIGAERVERVLRDSRVVAATLTGSTAAGRSIARDRGRARSKRRCSSSAGATRSS